MKSKIFLLVLFVVVGFLLILNKIDEQKYWENQWGKQLIKDQQWLNSHPLTEKIEPYPIKTACYWTSPVMHAADVPALARHDLVIADLENVYNNRASLLQLKRLNPNLKLLAYSNPMEIWTTTYSSRPWQNQVINEIVTKRPQWLLKTVVLDSEKGNYQDYAVFWQGMIMLNFSSTCPKIKGETYSKWMAKKISQEILSDPIWDGYFQDNGTVNISWVYPKVRQKIDIDGDGRPDSDKFVDKKWKQGVEKYLSIIQRKFKPKRNFLAFLSGANKSVKRNFLIITNKGDTNLLQFVDGKFFEWFPNDYLGGKWAGGWQQCVDNARITGPLTVFQVDRTNIDFGLASSLMLDNIYFAISQDDAGVFPQLYLDLGSPLGSAQKIGTIFIRQFQNYVVRVDPLNRLGEIIPAHLYIGEDDNLKNQTDSSHVQSEQVAGLKEAS
ncbi:MAG: putative glycoside hydrolase [Patescibacteria group bacterium]|jgi:hypothetical protein|nr:putative glycoside hydrolase [bacterium]HQC49617.1 putative glycoside hydrolase [bacterium]